MNSVKPNAILGADRAAAPRRCSAERARKTRSGQRSEYWGRVAEDQLAASYAERGGRIIARRVRTPAGEIDLVVALQNVLVFVEVKARRSIERALAALQPQQIERLYAAAAHFLATQPLTAGATSLPCDMRFDVAAVAADGRCEIVENALMEGLS